MVPKSVYTYMVVALAVASGVLSAACLAEDETTRKFPLQGFERVVLEGASSLEITQGDNFEVVATGPAEAIQYAHAEVRGDTLELGVTSKRKRFFGVLTVIDDHKVEFKVTLPQISAILVSGPGEARADTIESKELELRVTGSGDLEVDKLAAESLLAAITGSGDLTLGTVLAVSGETAITGSGDLRLDSYAGESLAARIKGSGDMLINGRVSKLAVSVMGSGDFIGRNLLSDKATGSVMGSGDIVLRNPGQQSFSVMGSGDVALVD
ncbi:GIN domain-containing protein [Microbulbifer sp. 2201CG32-9]|uniref:GIN domain-containing protein n=1 Tax=Microbulbifer sp. 2201CG32-9 TaxID=3232309 RepID=UPI00345BBAB2